MANTIDWQGDWVRSVNNNLRFFLINKYKPIPTSKKKYLWIDFGTFLKNNLNLDYKLGGDFNVILNNYETRGGSFVQAQMDFKDRVINTNMEITTNNGCYNLNNYKSRFNNIEGKLDRIALKVTWYLSKEIL
jgi:hypothetical protein